MRFDDVYQLRRIASPLASTRIASAFRAGPSNTSTCLRSPWPPSPPGPRAYRFARPQPFHGIGGDEQGRAGVDLPPGGYTGDAIQLNERQLRRGEDHQIHLSIVRSATGKNRVDIGLCHRELRDQLTAAVSGLKAWRLRRDPQDVVHRQRAITGKACTQMLKVIRERDLPRRISRSGTFQ